MNYEIVEMKEKKLVGLTGRTSNDSPKMMEVIGGLWTKLYSGTYENIQNKINQKRIGAYTNYDNGEYTSVIGCEVSKFENLPNETSEFVIPEGRYAKFVLEGNLHKIVKEFWEDLEQVDIDRSYVFDYEEYQDFDLESTTIIFYISVK